RAGRLSAGATAPGMSSVTGAGSMPPFSGWPLTTPTPVPEPNFAMTLEPRLNPVRIGLMPVPAEPPPERSPPDAAPSLTRPGSRPGPDEAAYARGFRPEPASAPELPAYARGLRPAEPASAPELPVYARGLRAAEPASAPEPLGYAASHRSTPMVRPEELAPG